MKKLTTFLLIIVALKASAQNVGIGTTQPGYPLTVIAQSNKGITQKDGAIEIGFYTSSTSAFLQTWSNHSLNFSTANGAAQMTILTGGNVGIGTNTPGAKLDINGLLRIRAGNPEEGAVLTSIDNNGNAVWKSNRYAFSVSGVNPNLLSVPNNATTVVHLYNEDFDYGNKYALYTGSSPSFGNSIFVAPVTGLYHFDAALALQNNDDDLKFPLLSIVAQRGANLITVAAAEFSPFIRTGFDQGLAQATICKDVKLVAGVIVSLRVFQNSGSAALIWQYGPDPHFGCHLIVQE
jgi:hypothetical protein